MTGIINTFYVFVALGWIFNIVFISGLLLAIAVVLYLLNDLYGKGM